MMFNWTLLSEVQSPDLEQFKSEWDSNYITREMLVKCPRLTDMQVACIRADVCPKCGHKLVTQHRPAYQSSNGMFRYEASNASACYGCDSYYLT
jgi:uncharacterized protein with PIN domain